jgi:hypothetical protein
MYKNMKSPLVSKTLWLAVLGGVIGVLQVLALNDSNGYVTVLLSLAQFINRFFTEQPIA